MGKRTNRVQEADTDRMIRRVERYPRATPIPDEVVAMTGKRTDATEPVPVDALIPVTYNYADTLQVEGEVIAWTARAALVQAIIQPGCAPVRVWVWQNAVKPR